MSKKMIRVAAVMSACAALMLSGCGNQGATVSKDSLSEKIQTLMKSEVDKNMAGQDDAAKKMAETMIKPMSDCIAGVLVDNKETKAIDEIMKSKSFGDMDKLENMVANKDKVKEAMAGCLTGKKKER